MSYSNLIKANNDLFEKMQFISVNDDIYITPIFAESIEAESRFYHQISNQADIKKYIPNAYVETQDQAKEKFLVI